MAARTIIDITIRHLVESLLLLKPGLRNFDQTRAIEDNVEITGVDIHFVRSYVLGLRAINPDAESAAEVDRDTAEKLMACYERIGKPLNDARDIIVEAIPDTEERKALLRPIGEMCADIWSHLQLPIVRKHPELDPDGDRFQKEDGSYPK